MRVKTNVASHRSKKRLFKQAKGNYGRRKNLIRTVKETLIRAGAYAFRDRRARKRDFRALWITRLNAACRMRGIRYSQFIHGLDKANIQLNRKSLSELAIAQPAIFDAIVEKAKAALG